MILGLQMTEESFLLKEQWVVYGSFIFHAHKLIKFVAQVLIFHEAIYS